MNYFQYLQEGGTAAAPSAEDQLVALVQAALQGDDAANSQIQQIMQAAQQGNQEAKQLAGAIQQIAQQLQGEGSEAVPAEADGGRVMKGSYGMKTDAPYYLRNQLPADSTTYRVDTPPVLSQPVIKSHLEQRIVPQPSTNDSLGVEQLPYVSGDSTRIFLPSSPEDKEDARKSLKPLPLAPGNQNWREMVKPLSRGGEVDKKPCPCALKKVGGRIVEVDTCTGKIVR